VVLAALLVSILRATPGLAVEAKTPIGLWTAAGYGEFYGVLKTDDDTRRQRPAGIFDLNLTGDVHPKVRLFLDTRVMFGGFPEDASGADLYNVSDTFQNVSPAFEIEEGYVDLHLGPVDFRIGKQKFVWGKLDTFQPTDILNPQRYNDPFVMDEQDVRIGVPGVMGTYYLPPLPDQWPRDVGLSLVWIPAPISTRFPLQRERWFPPAVDVAETIDVGAVDLLPTNPIIVENSLRTRNRQPAHQLDEGAVGLRVAGFYGKADWALYFYDGPETDPVLDFTPRVYWPEARDAARMGLPPPIPSPNEQIVLAADSDLTPRFERMRLFGADMAYEIAGFTVRAEGAYGMDRLLPRSVQSLVEGQNVLGAIGDIGRQEELAAKLFAGESVVLNLGDLFETSDTIEWGVGADYLWRGWLPLVQINQTVVLDDVQELLTADTDTQLLVAVRKSFFSERLKAEVANAQGLSRGHSLALFRAAYDITDHLRAQLGYLLLAGSRRDLIGQFQGNDEVFLRIRYSF
jgi:hypothetical protein